MKKGLLYIHLALALVLGFIALWNPAVGGEGDTIMHYFWANHVFNDADALFRSWAKPFFTLFASPWTLLGFGGIKLFNLICGVASSYLASLYAKERGWPRYWLIPLIAFLGPAYLSYLNTGLTEPFSALVLIGGIFLLERGKKQSSLLKWAYLLLSFLPFCRSEAQILLPLFAFYALVNKQIKFIPLLAFGTVAYSILGASFRNDIWWVFNTPYVSGASVYGKGNWTHYLERLNIMLSLPLNLAFLAGLLLISFRSLQNKQLLRNEFLLLVVASSLFILAHTVVWALGIYASAGLERVLILLFPLIWLIILYTLNNIAELIPKQSLKPILLGLLILLSLYSSFDRPRELQLYYKQAYQIGPYQTFLRAKVFPFIESKYPDYRNRQLVSDLPYLSLLSGHNPLAVDEQVNWQRVDRGIYQQLQSDALFIWDSHNVPFYTQISRDSLQNIPWLQRVESWEMGGREYVLLEVKGAIPKN